MPTPTQSLLLAPTRWGPNLINNPGIEVNATGYGGQTATETLARVTSEFHGGVASLQVDTPGGVASEGQVWTSTACRPGRWTLGEWWVKGTQGVALRVEIDQRSAADSSILNTVKPFTATGDWQYVSMLLKFGPFAAIFRHRIRTVGTIAVTWFSDDNSVRQRR